MKLKSAHRKTEESGKKTSKNMNKYMPGGALNGPG
jgi:hypothetical protein